jgi:hypothetical protein
VKLSANAVSFSKPGENFSIQLCTRFEAEGMDVIARGNIFDFRETRMFQAPGQYDVTDDSIPPQAHRRETHSDLKGDTRFFRNNAHGSAELYQLCEAPE